MKNFLIYTLATITGIVVASLLLFFILLGSLSVMVASGDKPASISENSVLVLKAGIPVPDRTDSNPFAGFDFINMTLSSAPGLNDILQNLEKAANDPKIKGILIENGLAPSGWGTTEEIRNALIEFKEKSGKFIISYADYILLQQAYYLSTAADKIFMSPSSTLDFKGLSGEIMFFKKALEKLGVEVQVTRHGKFKGAVEPYILDELSRENRDQINAYVGSIWDHVIMKISESRGIPESELNRMADELAGYVATGALENKLIDGLMFYDTLIDTLKTLSGLTGDDKINLVSMSKYTRVPNPEKVLSVRNRIAVIYASGTIVMGKGSDYNIGGNHYAEVIRKERLDSSVKAIVLRVNSPGGNAIASDIMWREVELASKVKPVVVSMGNVAASGGYYISAPAARIYADPTTISGSIGVFGLIPNAEKLMEQKLGISTETVNTNKYSDFPSLVRPMAVYEKEVMTISIERVYSDFISKVASGRKMSETSVDSIGQGRVWSGVNSIKIGLVDEIGGLKDAIRGAAELAGVDTYSIRELPYVEDPYMKLLNQLSGEVKLRLLGRELEQPLKIYKELLEIRDLSGIQTRLPYFIEIH
jgi:protease-4